jgi:hypothetical protein
MGGKALEINEAVNVVPGGVAFRVFLLLMLPNADFEFGSDADVEFLETVSQDINIGVFVHDTPFFPLSHLSHHITVVILNEVKDPCISLLLVFSSRCLLAVSKEN